MTGKPQLLCIGRDVLLNRTRRLILERCFEVRLAHTEAEAMALLVSQRFAVVLLCYSLPEDECRRMAEAAHSLPSPPRILSMADFGERLLLGPRDEEFLTGGPGDLLRTAAAMAGMTPDEAEKCADERAQTSKQPIQ
jgi:hypothetical protein